MNKLRLNPGQLVSVFSMLIGGLCLVYSFYCFAFLIDVELVNSVQVSEVMDDNRTIRVFEMLLWLKLMPLIGLILSLILIYIRHRSIPHIKWIIFGIGAICLLMIRWNFPVFGIIHQALINLIPELLVSYNFLISGMIFCCLGLGLILINWSRFLFRSKTVNNQQ
ncbi:MAG: hypothetical protein EP332_08010 [Bacteroidetes bacterium]|nr:MAG: hypothetical protein EP332_08010 [Bacteroidota bacterium]